MSKRVWILAGLAAFTTVLGTSTARAATVVGSGYVCRVVYYPPTDGLYVSSGPSAGQYGSVDFSVYTAPNCSGTFVKYLNLFSTGSSVNDYTGQNDIGLTDLELMEMHRSLITAADRGLPVYFSAASYNYVVGYILVTGYDALWVRFANY